MENLSGKKNKRTCILERMNSEGRDRKKLSILENFHTGIKKIK